MIKDFAKDLSLFQRVVPMLWLILFFILLTDDFACGQRYNYDKPRYQFHHLNIDLNNNMVESIYQDSYGYIWIGTLGGVHKFDGLNISLYLSSDMSSSVSGNRVGCILEDTKGRLWMGTESGICYYNREKDNFKRVNTYNEFIDPSNPTPDRIGSIVEDKNGRVWIGSERGGLLYLDEKENSFIPYFRGEREDGLHNSSVISLALENNNILWIGTANKGLFKLNISSGESTQYKHDPNDKNSIAGNYIEDLCLDRSNNLWIATSENGLDKFEIAKKTPKFIHYTNKIQDDHSLFNNAVTTVFEDSKGNIWVCNENGGLHLYDDEKDYFHRYIPNPDEPFSISNISVKVVYEDSQGRLWFGSNLEGVDIVDKYRHRFDHYFQSDNSNSINNNIVRNILEDNKGNLWIATDGGGLNYFDRGRNNFKAYQFDPLDPKSISSNAVLSLCFDANDRLWIGTWRGGINIWNEKDESFEKLHPENPSIDRVYYLLKDRNNNIWAGAQTGGINIYNWETKKFTNYLNNPKDSLSLGDNDVTVVFEDSEGNIWLGTEYNGLNLVINNEDGSLSFKRYVHIKNDENSFPHIKVNHIMEDSESNIWIATEGGLSKFLKENDRFENYSLEDGLESNHIKSVIEDDRGYLWIGTSKGISKFDKENKKIRNYTDHDGLQRGEFSRYSVYKTRRGELVFGGANGFNIFYPDSIRDNPFPPKVYLTDFKIFNNSVSIESQDSPLSKHISETDEITLSYKESVFSLEFVAINYTNPQLNQYAYMLEGFEDSWNYVGEQRTATYTNLDPGKYLFKVIATNNDGLWNMKGHTLSIIVTPPFWFTWWFKIIISSLLITMIYGIFYFRTRQLKRRNVELEEKVNERTSQLKGVVNELQEKQKQIKSTNAELKATLENLYAQKKQVETINNELDKRVQERTSKLLKANQELDRFVYSASHDLSAPLKSILGLINITMMENKNKALYFHLEHMKKSVLKLEDVIFHLTQFSRNLGREIIKKEFIFENLIEEILDDLSYLTDLQNVKIIRDYCTNETINSDFLRIKILITNLLTNAVKYRDKNKSEQHIKIRFFKDEQNYVLEVEDNGIGIIPKQQDKVFDMFYRGSTISQGSGLGLYIVKEIIEKLNGKLDLISEPAQFTRVTIKLPK